MRITTLCVLLTSLTLPAYAAQWCSAGAGEFSFAATIEGVATPGRFRKYVVDLEFDPANPTDGHLRVTVDLRAADMGDPDMNAVLFDPAWFDVDEFTEAIFASDDLRQESPGEFVATRLLDLKGVRKPVSVPFAWMPDGDGARMEGQFLLRRTDFDIGNGEWASADTIGVDVTLTFAIQIEHCA